jgi:hypothetical protein
MKQLFIILALAMTILACKKDPLKKECGIVYKDREMYALDSVALTYHMNGEDTVYTGVFPIGQPIEVRTEWCSNTLVCGQQFQNYKIVASENEKTQLTAWCPFGVTIYYFRYVTKTKQ